MDTTQKQIACRLAFDGIPTLGKCFAHQMLNTAPVGSVEGSGTSRLDLSHADIDSDDLLCRGD